MARYSIFTYGELYNGVVLAVLVVDSLLVTVFGRDHLLGKITFTVIGILDRIDDNLGSYDLVGKRNIRFGSTDEFTFFVLIIILLFCRNVNTSDDIPLAVVGIEKTPRPKARRETIGLLSKHCENTSPKFYFQARD